MLFFNIILFFVCLFGLINVKIKLKWLCCDGCSKLWFKVEVILSDILG